MREKKGMLFQVQSREEDVRVHEDFNNIGRRLWTSSLPTDFLGNYAPRMENVHVQGCTGLYFLLTGLAIVLGVPSKLWSGRG